MSGRDRATIWGGRSTIAAQARGLAGLVTNGSVRDVDQIRSIGFPVFATGISVRGTMRSPDGCLQISVSVGSVSVQPGDRIVDVAMLSGVREAADREKDQRASKGELS